MDDILPPTKQIIDNESIEIVKQLSNLSQELVERLEFIAEKAKSDDLGTRAIMGNQIKQLQEKLFHLNDIPVEEMGCWAIEARYIDDHNIAYLQRDEERYLAWCLLEKRLGKVEPS